MATGPVKADGKKKVPRVQILLLLFLVHASYTNQLNSPTDERVVDKRGLDKRSLLCGLV